MSEFKGTKGNEDEKFSYAFNILYPNWDYRDIVNQYEQNAIKGFHIGYNQALLDSKAPEMLDMLNTYLNDLNNIFPRTDACVNRMNKVNELIKSATEG